MAACASGRRAAALLGRCLQRCLATLPAVRRRVGRSLLPLALISPTLGRHPADGELEKLCLHQLNAAARDFVAAGGQQTSLAALALAGLSAASASSGLASPATASISEDAGAAGTGGQADGEGSDAAPSGTASPRSAASSAGASGNPGGTGPLGGAAAAASGRSGFMQRAFARQGAAGGVAGNGGEGAGGGVGPGRGGAASTTGAFALFQQRVREFNACVPYAGPQGKGASALSWSFCLLLASQQARGRLAAATGSRASALCAALCMRPLRSPFLQGAEWTMSSSRHFYPTCRASRAQVRRPWRWLGCRAAPPHRLHT